ncbi:hypothetical protein BDF20DRAFT_913909 [Mycotypha africana]|uniref:uncharacterized protein n=1 Tax=Mycotypha africana TaxID=64632 RepID=UPI002301425C|nr:uncharacterized protein BDF20DRAFT_913909 [Mycotypha africana]KAI8977594.1 hypothetical protein BDF20DRAFT_913909 [Mycotypha africana]
MASYYDELGIQPNSHKKKKTYDVDLDAFMNPASGSISNTSSSTLGDMRHVEQLLQTARQGLAFFGQFRQQMRTGGDVDQERFLDDLVSQLLEESQNEAKGPPPASKRFIDTLPNLNKNTLDKEESCIICKENLRSSDHTVTQLPCGHLFDLECIVPWLQLHHTCPMCRHKFETEEQVKEEEEEEQRSWMYG